jgi:hypothetical protein
MERGGEYHQPSHPLEDNLESGGLNDYLKQFEEEAAAGSQ